ncbi:hypothetical protein FISHEDRAFT_76845 [Fistulina hepatica ATCC 64428]|uniref:Mediator of RNA polymerase II transcription subunit 13 n=1 Tax=Fistulina hepatica ATCC 64428 TaxID=1128425 RepID=A0A0D7A458_9AGAR|nr:hypothetical protein FISHEDRAFT_76845 [Fistulina hepatica ATCC 64428]
MSLKSPTTNEQPGAVYHPPFPPTITLSDTLLASEITLPPNPVAAFTVFSGETDAIELARRSVLRENGDKPLLDCILTSVQACRDPHIYVFVVSSREHVSDALNRLSKLDFADLSLGESSSFALESATYGRPALRKMFSHLLEAMRIRLIDDVVQHASERDALRLKQGFLLSPPRPHLSDWCAGWEEHAFNRPYTYVHLQIQLQELDGSYLMYLARTCAKPLPSGTPMTLLPYGVPAYYLTEYTDDVAALDKLFNESLQGLGVRCNSTTRSQYVIGWISVENKHGDAKGLAVVYPVRLCLVFASGTLAPRRPLDFIPELPPQLQPSPLLAKAVPPISVHSGPLPGTILAGARTLQRTAKEAERYVDEVVKEREKARERLRSSHSGPAGAPKNPAFVSESQPQPQPAPPSTAPLASSFYPSPPAIAPGPSHVPASPARSESPLFSPVMPFTSEFPAPGPQTSSLPPVSPAPAPPTSGLSFPPSASAAANYPDFSLMDDMQLGMDADFSGLFGNMDMINMDSSSMGIGGIVDSSAMDLDVNNMNIGTAGEDSSAIMHMDLDVMMSDTMGMDVGNPFGNSFGQSRPFSQTLPSTVPAHGISTMAGTSSFHNLTAPHIRRLGNSDVRLHANGMSSGRGPARDMDLDDLTLTDDDFSFFDKPVVPAAPSRSVEALNSVASAESFGFAQPHVSSSPFFTAPHLSPIAMTPGPGAPASATSMTFGMTPIATSTPAAFGSTPLNVGATPMALGMTPQSFHDSSLEMVYPISPPLEQPFNVSGSFSEPASPNIKLQPVSGVQVQHPESVYAGPFDPISFALSHSKADAKYSGAGKFACSLPSPLYDDDTRPTPQEVIPSTSSVPSASWKRKYYDIVTNPSINAVNRLRERRRTVLGEKRCTATQRSSTSWRKAEYDKENASRSTAVESGDDDSDYEDDNEDAEAGLEDGKSRSATPSVPSYLPLSNTLLHSHFRHSHLLPLSKLFRPPGTGAAATSVAAPVMSVPTPVSPAALLGAASEKSKSLEAVAALVGREVVANSTWARVWRGGCPYRSYGGFGSFMDAGEFCADVQPWIDDACLVANLLSSCFLKGPLTLSDIAGIPNERSAHASPASDHSVDAESSFGLLASPMISIAKGGSVIQLLPTALRFWDKIGLGPRAGEKDVAAYAILEDAGGEYQQLVNTWLSSTANVYNARHLGCMELGPALNGGMEGLATIRFDNFRKTLSNAMNAMHLDNLNAAFFVIVPSKIMSLSSQVLRSVLSAVDKTIADQRFERCTFHLVAEKTVTSAVHAPQPFPSTLDSICMSVYDRILKPVNRMMSRQFFVHTEPVQRLFQAPAFSLARPPQAKVSFAYSRNANIDVLDKGTMLHIAYQISPSGKWILASSVDQRGESYDLGVWLTQKSDETDADELSPLQYAVNKVWDFAIKHAKCASVEWRVVVSRLGVMDDGELAAWQQLLACASISWTSTSIHVSLLCVESEAPWTLLSCAPHPVSALPVTNSKGSTSKTVHQLFVDVSSATYYVFPKVAVPLSVPPCVSDIGLSSSMVPDPCSATVIYNDASHHSNHPSPASVSATDDPDDMPHPLSILPLRTSVLLRAPASISASSVVSLHIHLLYIQTLPLSVTPWSEDTLIHDITVNFHELAVLAKARLNLDVNGILPFHLAAIDAMRLALDVPTELIPDP